MVEEEEPIKNRAEAMNFAPAQLSDLDFIYFYNRGYTVLSMTDVL